MYIVYYSIVEYIIYIIVYYIIYIILNYKVKIIQYNNLYLTYIVYSIVSDGQDRDN